MTENELTRKQFAAIKLGKRIGKILANDYPEIADAYRNGTTQMQIVEKYNLMEKYGPLSKCIARAAVQCALSRLISKNERYRLETDHRVQCGTILGNKTYMAKSGIFSLTSEQRTAVGQIGTLSKGHTLWSEEEKIYFAALCQNPEYNHSSGPCKGDYDYKKMAAELESLFGTKRTVNSLHRMAQRISEG